MINKQAILRKPEEEYYCPDCDKYFTIRVRYSNQKVTCPGCGRTIKRQIYVVQK